MKPGLGLRLTVGAIGALFSATVVSEAALTLHSAPSYTRASHQIVSPSLKRSPPKVAALPAEAPLT
jgi:hypothetical protein